MCANRVGDIPASSGSARGSAPLDEALAIETASTAFMRGDLNAVRGERNKSCYRPWGIVFGRCRSFNLALARGCASRAVHPPNRVLPRPFVAISMLVARRHTVAGKQTMTSTTLAPSASKIATVFRVTSGNFLEMFDFFLFGFYASHISAAFFPTGDEISSLLLTFATFGAGFLMRPLGALILGPYVDKVGRRQGLIVTLSIMAMGTILIAFVPSYATIGLAAPFLVLIGRLLQGFSAGVELGGVSVYLSEMATPGNKGFYVSWQSASQQVAIVVAALLGYGINLLLQPAIVSNWGWRIPFFVGCMIVPFILVIRRFLQETEEFLAR